MWAQLVQGLVLAHGVLESFDDEYPSNEEKPIRSYSNNPDCHEMILPAVRLRSSEGDLTPE